MVHTDVAIEEFVEYLRDREWSETWRYQISEVLQDLAVHYRARAVDNDVAGDDESTFDLNFSWHNFFVKGLKRFIRSYPENNPEAVEAVVDQLEREEIELKAERQGGRVVFMPHIPHKYMNHPDGKSPAQSLGPEYERPAKPIKLDGQPVSYQIVGEGVSTVRITNASQNTEFVVTGPATLQIMPAGSMPTGSMSAGSMSSAAAITENVVAGTAANPNKKRKAIQEGDIEA